MYSVQCTNLSLVSSVQAIVDVAREVLGVLSTVLLFQIDLGGTVSAAINLCNTVLSYVAHHTSLVVPGAMTLVLYMLYQ